MKPHATTSVDPLELVLAKPPGPITLKPMTSREEPKGHVRSMWKNWLQDTLKKAKDLLDKDQARYKKNYNARLRKKSEVIHEEYYVYLRVERKNRNDHRHKLAPVSKEPDKVAKFDDSTVIIKKTYWSIENISRSPVFIAPKPQTEREVGKLLKPMKLNKGIETENVKMKEIVA